MEALDRAVEEGARFLVDQWGFSIEEAFIFLSVACDANICQACRPQEFSTIARRRRRRRRTWWPILYLFSFWVTLPERNTGLVLGYGAYNPRQLREAAGKLTTALKTVARNSRRVETASGLVRSRDWSQTGLTGFACKAEGE